MDQLLSQSELVALIEDSSRSAVVNALREAVASVREGLAGGTSAAQDADAVRRAIIEQCIACLRRAIAPHYRHVINATGIILHTGLGRAVLAPRAFEWINAELRGYSLLQLDNDTGKRSQRDARIEWLFRQLTGAEAATVVNNNAAATMLVLNAIGAGKEVIVSRGQLVEIGGSFRLPEIMAASGARMVEVGTTNKTHLRDYAEAITEETAAILRVHPSNYRIEGFSSEVPLKALVELAHERGVALIDDVGAGPLVDVSQYGFRRESTLRESIAAGADVVTSSADKLIGASQGGVLLGKANWIERVRKNPLMRIVRPGKLTMTALEATLTLFLEGDDALSEHPTLRMLRRSIDDVTAQAERIAAAIRVPGVDVCTESGCSRMGSGSLPEQDLATRLVSIGGGGATGLSQRLRQETPPVFTRIQKDRVLIDPRTLQDGEETVLIECLTRCLGIAEAVHGN
ncbi:MAG: L-seryl-tRNA(Sec) selenium transferase [Lentisphaerae bacterium]|nr:L-seryl-tRNA(Sec) selenium transferase [Lentisphaerota bacterium]